jgi:hypothetical protein
MLLLRKKGNTEREIIDAESKISPGELFDRRIRRAESQLTDVSNPPMSLVISSDFQASMERLTVPIKEGFQSRFSRCIRKKYGECITEDAVPLFLPIFAN